MTVSVSVCESVRVCVCVCVCVCEGEILYRKREYDKAFEALAEAVRRDDALPYDEPWGWMQPTRHALGALMLEQKRYAAAKEVFLKDLKKWPNNLWSLYGLSGCEKELGNEKESKHALKLYAESAARLDVPMVGACFCANAKQREASASAPEISMGKCCERKGEANIF